MDSEAVFLSLCGPQEGPQEYLQNGAFSSDWPEGLRVCGYVCVYMCASICMHVCFYRIKDELYFS